MQIGMVGLGKMGGNMARRLLRAGHWVFAFDPRPEAVRELTEEGAVAASSLADLVQKIRAPRSIWVMVPSGQPTEDTIRELSGLLEKGDTILDGGNSNYHDTLRRAADLASRGLGFVDVGTSGGIWGLADGYSMMIGGEEQVVERHRSVFEAMAPAPDQGWGRVGPVGAGHFVKMVHNGIEYGVMRAYAEGFELMHHKSQFGLDLRQVAAIWEHGSVIRSWLLELAERALRQNPTLEGIAAYVPDSGEGRWTVVEAIELSCSIPVITMALESRFRSREEAPFADKLLAALRNQFGGHAVRTEKEK
ncbi:MAG: phosphogluconate dehydrogenase (NAD(+)-dependent, decarboxylating) [Anaerolineales bacterium]